MGITISIILGFILLVVGGDTLVKGAVAVARKMGLSELLIGLTLVGIGTSMPELVTNLEGALTGVPDLAVGNVVGSNICNILLILGTAAAIYPITCPNDLLRRDGIWLVLSLLVFVACELFGSINQLAGVVFIGLLAAYMIILYKQEKTDHGESAQMHEHEAEVVQPWLQSTAGGALLVVVGLALTIGGAKLAVSGAVALASSIGVSDMVIGLTVVALGTSLPELVTAVMAARRGASDVALGTVIGSNIFNIFMVLGMTSIIHPLQIPAEALTSDIPMMVISTLLLLVFIRSGRKLSRTEGSFFVLLYFAYMAYSVMR